jgi:hypothetical protein
MFPSKTWRLTLTPSAVLLILEGEPESIPDVSRVENDDKSKANRFSSLPCVLAAAWMFATACVADGYRKRGLIIISNCAWVAISPSYVQNPRTRYAGVFLGVLGANPNVPSLSGYMHRWVDQEKHRECAAHQWWCLWGDRSVECLSSAGCSKVHVSFALGYWKIGRSVANVCLVRRWRFLLQCKYSVSCMF